MIYPGRNWLDLALDTDPAKPPRLWANWWFQGEDTAPATQKEQEKNGQETITIANTPPADLLKAA